TASAAPPGQARAAAAHWREPVRLSVVVPVLDEAQRIGQRLPGPRSIARVDRGGGGDGGSGDGTTHRVPPAPPVRLSPAPRGRGPQLNAGGRAAHGDVLLFLHADVSLPPDAATWVARTLADPAVVAGAFRVRTIADEGPGWLGPLLRLADLRSRV